MADGPPGVWREYERPYTFCQGAARNVLRFNSGKHFVRVRNNRRTNGHLIPGRVSGKAQAYAAEDVDSNRLGAVYYDRRSAVPRRIRRILNRFFGIEFGVIRPASQI